MADLKVEETGLPAFAVTAVVGAILLIFVFLCNFVRKGLSTKETDVNESGDGKVPARNGVAGDGPAVRKKEKVPLKRNTSRGATFSHSWLVSSMKTHNGEVLGLDFSPNGKYMATCSEDRTVLIWNMKEFSKKDRKILRANVELDHATKVRFSPDSKAFIVSLFNAETVRVFKIGRKDDGSPGNIQAAFDFPQKHAVEIINIGIASNGKFIMTCYRDTTMKIWDIRGELLSTIDTRHMNNTYGTVSPCGRFVASSGFTPDVKVWEVCFDKSGTFKEVTRAFELKGHTAGIYSFAFNGDSTRMVTVSKDGTWRLWDTHVEYQKRQDPYQLKVGRHDYTSPCLVAMAPDARSVAIATGCSVALYSTATMQLEEMFEDAHTARVTAIDFSVDSRYLVSTGDRTVNIYHNVTGLRATVVELEEKKRVATTQAMKERLQQQIDEALGLLKSIEDKKAS